MPIGTKSRRPRLVEQHVLGTVWAVEEQTFGVMLDVLRLRSVGQVFTDEELSERLDGTGYGSPGALVPGDEDEPHGPVTVDGVRLLPVHGVLAPRMNVFSRVSGGTSTQQLARWFREAVDDRRVRAIVLDVDSPGGDAHGNEELSTLIRNARGRKPVKAVVTGMGASAAFHVASAVDEVIASPSSEVGSIGCLMIHSERSRKNAKEGVTYTVFRSGDRKADGNAHEPLTDAARTSLQERVDSLSDQFVRAVAENRGVPADVVEREFGQGKLFIAARARDVGLVDRLATLEEVVSELAAGSSGTASRGSRQPHVPAATEAVSPRPVSLGSAASAGPAIHSTAREAVMSRFPGGATITATHDEKLNAAVLEVLSHRCGIGPDEPLSGTARDLEHASLVDIAAACLQARGVDVPRGMLSEDVAALALRGPEARVGASDFGHGRPADFPIVLSNLAGKIADDAMEFSPATFRNWAAPLQSVPDFRPQTIIRTGEFAEFPRVEDGDEFQESTYGEEASWLAADKYGDEWSLTPAMIANDNLGVFEDAVRDKQISHDLTLNRLCVNLLTGNAQASDGTDLFHADHGNDRTAGSTPSTTELAAMRLLLRKQTGIDSGRRHVSLKLTRVVVPSDLETDVEKLLRADLQIVPETESNTQPFRGTVGYDVEPMLDANSTQKWYGFADRRVGRAIRYAFMRGYERMRVRSYTNDKTQSRVFQFEGRFAAAVDNWRATVRNAGTGA